MRRFVCLLAGVLLVMPTLGSDTLREYDGEAVWDDGLQGTWQFVEGRSSGEIKILVPGGPVVRTFRRGRWEYRLNGELESEGVYATDTSRNPAYLDETTMAEGQAAGKTRKLLYRIDGDTLRTAISSDGSERPDRFDESLYIVTWKRVKK